MPAPRRSSSRPCQRRPARRRPKRSRRASPRRFRRRRGVRTAGDLGLRAHPAAATDAGRAGAGPSGPCLRLACLPQSRDGRLSVDPDAGDDPRACALPVPERQRFARQQRAFRPAEPARAGRPPQDLVSIWFFWASAAALGLATTLHWIVSGKFGSVIRGIRDDEARVRFLGYPVEGYKLFVFTLTAVIAAIAGALYYPQAGIINPAELAPIASIYLAVWVAIGGRGRLYGAVIGAAFVSLLSAGSPAGARRRSPWLLHHQLGGLVAGRAGPVLRRRHPLRAQGHRRAVRPLPGPAARPTARARPLAPMTARCRKRRRVE